MSESNSDSLHHTQSAAFPELPLNAWQDTYTTLHLWTQIVGKIRLAASPMLNHWWQATLYLTARGLTTSTLSYGDSIFQIDFDFIDHSLHIQDSNGAIQTIPFASHSVASFYSEIMDVLHAWGIDLTIWTTPVEVDERIPFEEDEQHASYDPEYANKFWRILLQANRVMKHFRGPFTGKASPVHFFWGSFDLAAGRFSGRRAPLMQSAYHVARYVMQEAYADEVSSCGFWPGVGLGEPAFYAYTYPEPSGYAGYPIQPSAAYYHPTLREFILPYEAVRTSGNWDQTLLSFFQSTYEAGANLNQWDRTTLERKMPLRSK